MLSAVRVNIAPAGTGSGVAVSEAMAGPPTTTSISASATPPRSSQTYSSISQLTSLANEIRQVIDDLALGSRLRLEKGGYASGYVFAV